MIKKPITAIVETDLTELIESGVPEGKQLEFKRELPDASDQGKVKFLRSVTAFANTQGGDLIYGMDATDGVPMKLVPLTMLSSDQVLQRLEQLCAGGVEPRLTGVQYRFVPLTAGGSVLVIRVAKSWSTPHRVTAGGHSHFYGRNAAGAYPLDVGELRQAFTLSESIIDRIRAFRANRLILLGANDGPVRLVDGARVVLHVIPLQSFAGESRVDVVTESDALRSISPPGSSGWSSRLNLDGRLRYSQNAEKKSSAYVMVFRAGVIEAVSVIEEWNGERTVPSLSYEEELIESLKAYLRSLQQLGISPPVFISLSMLGIGGYRFAVNTRRFFRSNHMSDRDTLIFPEFQLDDLTADVASAMRSTFDMVWNAFGYERSFNYDENGQWSPQR